MVRMVWESVLGSTCKLMVYDASAMAFQDAVSNSWTPVFDGYIGYAENYHSSIY
jgi:hypothetical protein